MFDKTLRRICAAAGAAALTMTVLQSPTAQASPRSDAHDQTHVEAVATISPATNHPDSSNNTFNNVPLAAKKIATITLVTAGDGGVSGHSFLVVNNISSGTVKVAGFSIVKGKSMSIGTFGNKSDGKGVYFNLELYKQYKTDESITSGGLAKDDISSLSSYIKNNNSWSCPANCSTFASGAWNLVEPAALAVNAGFPNTPSNLEASVKALPGDKKNIKLPKRAASSVKRLRSDNSVVDASAKTLNDGSSGSIFDCF